MVRLDALVRYKEKCHVCISLGTIRLTLIECEEMLSGNSSKAWKASTHQFDTVYCTYSSLPELQAGTQSIGHGRDKFSLTFHETFVG